MCLHPFPSGWPHGSLLGSEQRRGRDCGCPGGGWGPGLIGWDKGGQPPGLGRSTSSHIGQLRTLPMMIQGRARVASEGQGNRNSRAGGLLDRTALHIVGGTGTAAYELPESVGNAAHIQGPFHTWALRSLSYAPPDDSSGASLVLQIPLQWNIMLGCQAGPSLLVPPNKQDPCGYRIPLIPRMCELFLCVY